jgi:hypothetical protein
MGQVDTLIAHEIVHALQFTELPATLGGGIPTWFIEGVAIGPGHAGPGQRKSAGSVATVALIRY